MDVRRMAAKMKAMSFEMAASDIETRNAALFSMRDAIIKTRERIFDANAMDLKNASENGVSESVVQRLRFDEKKCKAVCDGIGQLAGLPDPIGRVTLHRQLDDDLVLMRRVVPIGVLGVIFEARPDAMVQIASLCIKSGNCAILKGGSETRHTNAALFEVMHEAVTEAGLADECIAQADSHEQVDALLECDESVDLLIPRGSNAFVRYIMDHSRIPVMGHADGICHTYIDGRCDIEMAKRIAVDAKLQYAAACNATETLLVDSSLDGKAAKELIRYLSSRDIAICGDDGVKSLGAAEILELPEDEYEHEYLAPMLGVKLVDGVREAVRHINSHGSHHTDCIVTEDKEAAEYFVDNVDSAGVYVNASTRFADGFRYGFGAEVGISTGKLHARGPVGLEGLTTYKYILRGSGNIVSDYAEGRRSFKFRDDAPL